MIGRRACPYRLFGRLVIDRVLGARVIVRGTVEQLRRKWRNRQQHDGCRNEGEAEPPKDSAHSPVRVRTAARRSQPSVLTGVSRGFTLNAQSTESDANLFSKE